MMLGSGVHTYHNVSLILCSSVHVILYNEMLTVTRDKELTSCVKRLELTSSK